MSTSSIKTTEIAQRSFEARGEDKGRKGPFFEVSKIVSSPDMLKGWVEWFKGLNIPCAVMKTRRGYVLWRKGVEIGRTRSKNSSDLITKNIVYSFGI